MGAACNGGIRENPEISPDNISIEWDISDNSLPKRFEGKPSKICVVGSGNFGSTIAKVVAENAARLPEFEDEVTMWTFDEPVNGESIVKIINERHENIKYLPGVKLPVNIVSVPDLTRAVSDADLLIFICPHQFLPRTCSTIKGKLKPNAIAITAIKGMFANDGEAKLCSTFISETLEIPCSAISGANVAKDMANEQFCGATIGSASKPEANLWMKAFTRPYFTVRAVRDISGVQACGALKNVIALGSGFSDGLGYGTNTKSEIMRQGMDEIIRFAQIYFTGCDTNTFLENCGYADLITTCFSGRNRRCGEAFVKSDRSWEQIEAEELKGQKIAGLPTTKEVHEIIVKSKREGDFPLFVKIHDICYNGTDANTILDIFKTTKQQCAGGAEMPEAA